MAQLVNPLVAFARDCYRGSRDYLGYLAFERPLGVRTSGLVRLEELGLRAEGRVDSQPSPWLAFARLVPKASVGPQDTFVDFGSGKGRAVFQAATYPFGRVIGVELSAELTDIARENLAHHRRVRAHEVQLVTADALGWPIPDDLTVAYFFNPFMGEVFHKVIHRLIASYDRHPRPLRIVYVNPTEHDFLVDTGRVRPLRYLRGWRPGAAWSRSNSAWLYEMR